jgi:predicted transcriptional regulator
MINIKDNKKTNLKGYDYSWDIKNRIFLSQLGEVDFLVLEEVLFSPAQFSMRIMAKNLNLEEAVLLKILQNFEIVGLVKIEGDSLKVDKESRKYFEIEMGKFEKNQIPGVEFIQNMLKKVPSQVLPAWYRTPAMGPGGVFESLIDKYLYTPEIFQNHMIDLYSESPIVSSIAQEVFRSPELEVSSKDLLEKLQISREQFQEYMLILEFHFVCCLRYQKVDNRWEERVAPFREWKEFLLFLKNAAPAAIQNGVVIESPKEAMFSFIEDMAFVLHRIEQGVPEEGLGDGLEDGRLKHILYKLNILNCTEMCGGKREVTDWGLQWLELNTEEQALYCYRHPNNRLYSMPNVSQKLIRQAEKAVVSVLDKGWVLFEDFFKGITVPLGEHPPVALRKEGKFWKYTTPYYSTEEKELLYFVIHEWLFEIGAVVTGGSNNKECFMVTEFGKGLFDLL